MQVVVFAVVTVVVVLLCWLFGHRGRGCHGGQVHCRLGLHGGTGCCRLRMDVVWSLDSDVISSLLIVIGACILTLCAQSFLWCLLHVVDRVLCIWRTWTTTQQAPVLRFLPTSHGANFSIFITLYPVDMLWFIPAGPSSVTL